MLFNGGMDPNLNPEYNEQNNNPQCIDPKPNVVETVPVKRNGKMNNLVLWGFIFSFLFPFVGLIICVISLQQMKKKGETGKGFAIAGITVALLSYVAPFIIMFIINNYYSNELVKSNYLKPACKMRDEEGKYESSDGIIKCEDNICVYDDGKNKVVLTCK